MLFCAYTGYLHPARFPEFSYFGLAFPLFLSLNALFILLWLIVEWKMVALPLAGMLLCAKSVFIYTPMNLFEEEAPEGSIKLLSYNVMNFGGKPMANIDYASNPIVSYILSSEADIVCLQEGSVVNLPLLKQVLSSEYPYIQQGAEDGCHYNLCMSKYPILEAENVPFVSKTNRTYAYKILVHDDTLLIVNNHFESYHLHNEDVQDYKDIIKNPKDNKKKGKYLSLTHKLSQANALRGSQADCVAEYIDSVQCKYKVACGDFNDSPLSYTHRRMTRTLRDAYVDNGFGPGISFHMHGMYFRIDNILVNENIATYQTKVDNSIAESDHYPIISHIFLKLK